MDALQAGASVCVRETAMAAAGGPLLAGPHWVALPYRFARVGETQSKTDPRPKGPIC